MYTIDDINQMPAEEFVEKIGVVFEHSPWVAAGAAARRPFDSREDMYACMTRVMYRAPEEKKLSLLRAHPDLGTKLEVTDASRAEQQGAGLNQLTEKEYERMASLNQFYTETFGFPFILAVKGKTKEEILANMQERAEHEREMELDTALSEVAKIALFRIQDLVSSGTAVFAAKK